MVIIISNNNLALRAFYLDFTKIAFANSNLEQVGFLFRPCAMNVEKLNEQSIIYVLEKYALNCQINENCHFKEHPLGDGTS